MPKPTKAEAILSTDYSLQFDELRKNAVCQSFYKYGPARDNFPTKAVDAIGCIRKCLEKFEQTKNTEYLVDVANYAMFRFMFPIDGEYFRRTSSDESAGIDGISINEMKEISENNKMYGW